MTWGCSTPWLRPLLGLLLIYKSLIQMILPFFDINVCRYLCICVYTHIYIKDLILKHNAYRYYVYIHIYKYFILRHTQRYHT